MLRHFRRYLFLFFFLPSFSYEISFLVCLCFFLFIVYFYYFILFILFLLFSFFLSTLCSFIPLSIVAFLFSSLLSSFTIINPFLHVSLLSSCLFYSSFYSILSPFQSIGWRAACSVSITLVLLHISFLRFAYTPFYV